MSESREYTDLRDIGSYQKYTHRRAGLGFEEQ